MSIVQQLRQIAEEKAAHLQADARELEREKLQIEARLLEIEAARKSSRLAAKRLADFTVLVGADYQCPSCWMDSETRSSIRPIGGGTKNYDFFRCNTCHREISIAF